MPPTPPLLFVRISGLSENGGAWDDGFLALPCRNGHTAMLLASSWSLPLEELDWPQPLFFLGKFTCCM